MSPTQRGYIPNPQLINGVPQSPISKIVGTKVKIVPSIFQNPGKSRERGKKKVHAKVWSSIDTCSLTGRRVRDLWLPPAHLECTRMTCSAVTSSSGTPERDAVPAASYDAWLQRSYLLPDDYRPAPTQCSSVLPIPERDVVPAASYDAWLQRS